MSNELQNGLKVVKREQLWLLSGLFFEKKLIFDIALKEVTVLWPNPRASIG